MVRRGVQDTARDQAVSDQVEGGRLQQATFVMARLWPRVGEEDADTAQRTRCDQTLQHVERISADQPDIAHLFTLDRAQQLRQPPAVDFHRDHIDAGFFLCHRQR